MYWLGQFNWDRAIALEQPNWGEVKDNRRLYRYSVKKKYKQRDKKNQSNGVQKSKMRKKRHNN